MKDDFELRDLIAFACLIVLLWKKSGAQSAGDIAREAYFLADAMTACRKVRRMK